MKTSVEGIDFGSNLVSPTSGRSSQVHPLETQEPPVLRDLKAKLKVIGVGGGGGNAVEHMISRNVQGVDFICANTDAQALSKSNASILLQLGSSGLGAGARPEFGMQCAVDAEQEIRQTLEGCQMVFITAGLGGGTGTGAAPVIARIAKDMGILTVGVVTKPFEFEGARRARAAEEGLLELERNVDSLIVVLNDRLLEVLGDDVTQEQAFNEANEVLRGAVGGIANVILVPGLINVDFEDVKTVMEQPGRAMMGSAQASGPDRAFKAAEAAVACPLLEGINLSGATGVLVLISATRGTLKLAESKSIMNTVKRYAHQDAQIIMGAAFDDELGDALRVTVIATGLATIKSAHEPAQKLPGLHVVSSRPTPVAPELVRESGSSAPQDLSQQPAPLVQAQRQPVRPGIPRAEDAYQSADRKPQAEVSPERAQVHAVAANSFFNEPFIPAFLRKRAS